MLEALVDEECPDDYIEEYCFIADAQHITVDVEEVTGSWILPMLLGNDVNGNSQQWQIGFDGTNLVIQHGRVGGALQTASRAVVCNTSGRNIFQQSLINGKRRYTDKCIEGYHAEGSDARMTIKPMLANVYSHTGKQISQWSEVIIQPKLDGVRCLISNQSTGIIKTSRSNRCYMYMEHIDRQAKLLLSMLPPGTILDGELYNHQMEFEEIISIVRRTKNPHPEEHKIQYWIFDLIPIGSNKPFEDRYTLLVNAYNSIIDQLPDICIVPLHIYPTHTMTEENIKVILDVMTNDGYEGFIMRKTGADSEYVMGRCSNIFKVKKFETAEGYVINVFPSSGTEADCAMFTLYDPITNATFPIRPAGSFEQRREWLRNPAPIINQLYTYQCVVRKVGELPRHPTGVGFRDYE